MNRQTVLYPKHCASGICGTKDSFVLCERWIVVLFDKIYIFKYFCYFVIKQKISLKINCLP